MKKLLALILALFMLCACAVQEEPVIEEPPKEPTEEPSEPKVEFFTAANGKSGAKLDGKVIIEPEYSILELYDDFILAKNEYAFRLFGYDGIQRGFDYDYFRYDWDTDIYRYVGVIAVGGMMQIEINEKFEPAAKVTDGEKHYLIDKEGYPLIDVPLESYEIWRNTREDETELLGTSDGNYYHAIITGSGKDRQVNLEETKPEPYIDEFGYEHTQYQYYPIGRMQQGLNINGEVFLEPIYNKITVPFKDRVILWYASFEQCLECGYCKIIDLDKNVVSNEFNCIQFGELEDGWYIGIARSAGDMSEDKICDKNGNPMEKGMWFVDKNGTIISPKIQGTDSESAAYYGYDFSLPPITSVNDVLNVRDENGNEIQIAIKDYVFKP